MSYIGNTVTTVPFITDTFSGNASAVNFTLTRAPAGTASIAVFIAGVYQPPTNYTLSGTTLTFNSAPGIGTNNIVVLHMGNGSATQVPSDGSVTLSKLSSDSYGYINSAFSAANTGGSGATYANSAFIQANAAFLQANTPDYVANSAASYANSGFAVANSASLYANSAFLKANTPDYVANSAASYANAAFTQANTDVTNISITSGTYGNSSYYPIVTLSANGRVNTVTTQALTSSSAIPTMNVLTTGTSQTWTIPAGVTRVRVTVVGGGGAGGTGTAGRGGGGGGGGGTAIKVLTGLTSGNTLTYTVGGAGATSQVASGTQTITTVSATAGGAGSTETGAAGGIGSNGDLNIGGQGGGAGFEDVDTAIVGGTGGSSYLGGGGYTVKAAVSGNAGRQYGGGGSGGGGSSGGAGAAGVVIFEY